MKWINKCVKNGAFDKRFASIKKVCINLISNVTLIRDAIIKVSLKSFDSYIKHPFSYHLGRVKRIWYFNIAYASSEGSGEPVHLRSLARISAARSYKQWVKRNLQTESQIPGPSEWLGMRS